MAVARETLESDHPVLQRMLQESAKVEDLASIDLKTAVKRLEKEFGEPTRSKESPDCDPEATRMLFAVSLLPFE
ncbi:MAG: hypothetical protein IPK72_21760 [Candidatus Eisenbacteria bacterium]|nr:hypothetical protein [Candidatus Eisenbacteria bacterium]